MLVNESLACHTANAPLPPRLVPQTLIAHGCGKLGPAVCVQTLSGIDGDRLSDHPCAVVTLPG